MKLHEVRLCPACVRRARGRFGVAFEGMAPDGGLDLHVVVRSGGMWPERSTRGVYHARTGKRNEVGMLVPGKLLCRDEVSHSFDCGRLSEWFQEMIMLGVEATRSWWDRLVLSDVPAAEIEEVASRCEDLALVALKMIEGETATAVPKTAFAAAAERLAQAAQLELLYHDCAMGYCQLHEEVKRAAREAK